MAAIGGSIESVILAGRQFPVAADTEVQRKLGGFNNEVLANGDGTARVVKTREPWMLDGLTVEVDDTRNDHEFLQSLADGSDLFPVVITYASGVSYQGQGQITGEIQYSNQSAQASVTLAGSGGLSQQ